MKYIRWIGSPVTERTIHGYTWRNGDVVLVENDEIAEDILTQPGENFEEEPALTDIDGIGPVRARELTGLGIVLAVELAELPDERLPNLADKLSGVSVEKLETWRDSARTLTEKGV